MDAKTITKAREKALQSLYQKNFDDALKNEVVRMAERQAGKVARELAKDPKFQKQIQARVKSIITKDLDKLVAEATKDAYISW